MFKFRTLVKLPKYNRFTFPARYYDAEKEERENRRKRILGEAENLQADNIKKRIKFASTRKNKMNTGSTALQLFLMLFLMTLVIGYLYFGKPAIYAAIALACVGYFAMKFLKR